MQDKVFTDDPLYFSLNNPGVMDEILNSGSVVASFDLYEDFLVYSGGVYTHLYGKYLGQSYARIVGWGVTKDSQKYWLAAYDKGSQWGEDGFFRIQKDTNECGFETEIIAGNVLLH